MAKWRFLLGGLLVAAFGVLSFVGASNSKASVEDSRGKFWNASSLGEAEKITGYQIGTPNFIPGDFRLASKFMISEYGHDENMFKIVERTWTKGNDRSVRLTLIQSPRPFEIGGGQPAEILDTAGQRIFTPATPDAPARLAIQWQSNGMHYILGSVLEGEVDEQVVNSIAASLSTGSAN